ncbi:helix-turn-helix domain-containing protein [Alkalibacillus silvisoli]|uniref:Helix-turn-helix conjugative transposon-like domain-containing protein n=1 Tax=Alkalibacillus silvisoli TaxID=392823 RepID=A0ABP3JXP3_9BACI
MTNLGLYELTYKIKKDKEKDDAIMEIISLFEPKIKTKTKTLDVHTGEDLKQELTIEITKALKRFDLERAPNLTEYMKNKQHKEKEGDSCE